MDARETRTAARAAKPWRDKRAIGSRYGMLDLLYRSGGACYAKGPKTDAKPMQNH
jgi:hypothetical protein